MPTETVDEHFLTTVAALRAVPRPRPDDALAATYLDLYDDQCASRHADLAARWLQQQGRGYYTIGSSGHEGNAALAAALRPTDPALLHYRSGAFYVTRARQVPGTDPVRDILRGVVASVAEPISGGRHKVFGHADLAVIPQTSTIASHLPRAVGVAFAIERTRKLGVPGRWPADAVAVCSFGDASANHSTAAGAINIALRTAYQGQPLPLLFVCEDNGLGISVPTPDGWIESAYGHRPGLTYLTADAGDLVDTLRVCREAADVVRRQRRPVFLHLRTVRLMGHAGSDAELAYRSPVRIAADLDRDPLVTTARLLVDAGLLTPPAAIARYEAARAAAMDIAAQVLTEPGHESAASVRAPLAPRRPQAVAAAVVTASGDSATAGAAQSVTLAQAINMALADELARRPNVLLFGEDVAVKGGVYGVTRGLRRAAGPARVFDTPLDEQSILGLALGAAVSGLLPVPEIQYLAYLHNAEDQIRGEAATLRFFSQGQFTNPMVVRVAGLAYQRGFGGHFHNDNALGVLRDIPGLVLAVPARPDDAAAMLRTCLASAAVDGSVCVFLEPIALYHTRDLHTDGDGGWLAAYPPASDPAAHVPVGSARTHGDGADLTLVTFGNGVRMCLRVLPQLAAEGVRARVLDLRWLAPLPTADLLREARATGRVLVVDETRHTGGVGEGIVTALVEAGFAGALARVSSADSFVPLGAAAGLVLLDEQTVLRAALALAAGDRPRSGAGHQDADHRDADHRDADHQDVADCTSPAATQGV